MGTKNNHPTIGKSFEVDQIAIAKFKSILPPNWLCRKQEPDVFLDFVVETVVEGEPTGVHFGVQVKGRSNLKYTKKGAILQFKTKHLSYYSDKCLYPVFVVLVDVDSKRVFLIFAQKHVKEMLSKFEMTKDKTNLKVSLDKEFLSLDKFNQDLQAAVSYIRDMHPGTIQAALAKKKSTLEAKDPRVKIEIEAACGYEKITISPKDPSVNLGKISFKKNPAIQDALRRMIESGEPVKISSEHVIVSDMPIVEDALKAGKGEIILKKGTEISGYVEFFGFDSGNESSLQIQGFWRWGTKYATFSGELFNKLVRFSATFPVSGSHASIFQGFTITFDSAVWCGMKILQLPYFTHVFELFKKLVSENGVECKCFINGVRIAVGRLNQLGNERVKSWVAQIEWLSRAREVAAFHGINPVLPLFKNITDRQIEDIEDAYCLLSVDKYERPNAFVSIDMVVTEVSKEPEIGKASVLRIEPENFELNIFGDKIFYGKVVVMWVEMVVTTVIKQAPKVFKVVIQGGASTRKILERIV